MRLTVAIITAEKREHDKDYANPTPAFGTAPEALLQGFALLPEVDVHVISCVRQPVNAPEKLAANIWYHALVVPKIGWLRTLYQGCLRATGKKLREIKPDIVHGQGTEQNNALGAIFSRRPNVVTVHGNMRLIARLNNERPFSFNWLAARLESFTLPRTDGVVCITNYTRAAVAGLAKKTWLVPNAVDAGFFDVQSSPDPNQLPVGLVVGTICRRKNQNHFIRALDSLAAKKKFRMIFLGTEEKSPYGEEFLQLVRERPWCEHVGFAGRDRLKDYFKRAAFLALPSLEDNCPMTVLEAAAAGVPVLAANVGGVPDLIDHGRTGLLCDPLDAASMSSGVERLLEDRAGARQLVAAAQAEARRRFHPLVVARRHLEIYREVLDSRRRF